jgi:hypothetical protein
MTNHRGLSVRQRAALARLLSRVLTTPGIDPETERRAKWLKDHLEGRDPLQAIDRLLLQRFTRAA